MTITPTLFPQQTPALDDVWVALDLETTGLSPESDEIIEIGAVKFRGAEELGAFQSFVNPDRSLSEFVKRLTGIRQDEVDAARPFAAAGDDLIRFVGAAPVVAHNVPFDLRFLASKGLRLSNPRCDTWDLAYVLLPGARDYSLSKLAASVGIDHTRPHRALPDAKAAHKLFLKLMERAAALDVYTLAEMEQLASKSAWVLSYLLRSLATEKIAAQISAPAPASTQQASPTQRFTVGGLDLSSLKAGSDIREPSEQTSHPVTSTPSTWRSSCATGARSPRLCPGSRRGKSRSPWPAPSPRPSTRAGA